MAESRGEHVAGFVAGPIGGIVIWALLVPVGCAVSQYPCPPTLQENFLGLTLGGWVGNVSDGGAALIGIVGAIFVGYGVDAFWPRSQAQPAGGPGTKRAASAKGGVRHSSPWRE